MFKTILLALDGSEGARRAVQPAVDLARDADARIIIANVEEQVASNIGFEPVHADQEAVQSDIRRTSEELSGEGIEASVKTATAPVGGPAHAIHEIAKEEGADLIVVGTRGQSPVKGCSWAASPNGSSISPTARCSRCLPMIAAALRTLELGSASGRLSQSQPSRNPESGRDARLKRVCLGLGRAERGYPVGGGETQLTTPGITITVAPKIKCPNVFLLSEREVG
jgi:nucleotide-binding universal stress UspA family protein